MKNIYLLSFIISLFPFLICHATQLPNPSLSTADPSPHAFDDDSKVPNDYTTDKIDIKPSVDANDTLNLQDAPFEENYWHDIDFAMLSSDEDLDSIIDTSSPENVGKKPGMPAIPKVEEPAEEKLAENALENPQEPPNNQAHYPFVAQIKEKKPPAKQQDAPQLASQQNNKNILESKGMNGKRIIEPLTHLSAVLHEDMKNLVDMRHKSVTYMMRVAAQMKENMLTLSQLTLSSNDTYQNKLMRLTQTSDTLLNLSVSFAEKTDEIKKRYSKAEKILLENKLDAMERYLTTYKKVESNKLDLRYYQLEKQQALDKKRFEMRLKAIAKTHLEAYKKNKRDQEEKERQALQGVEIKNKELQYQLNEAKNKQEIEKMKLELVKLEQEEKARRALQALKRQNLKNKIKLEHKIDKIKLEHKIDKIKNEQEGLISKMYHGLLGSGK